MGAPPNLVVLAGPNGAGKTTVAPGLLQGLLGVTEFVNADAIARGLSAFHPEGAALAAGRIMLVRLKELAVRRADFAFETTLASKTFAPWIAAVIAQGYHFHLHFLWLPSAEAAVERVRERVRQGGHDIPEPTIRRRYSAGLTNFFRLYRPLTSTWEMLDNSAQDGPTSIAAGHGRNVLHVDQPAKWEGIVRAHDHE